MASSGNLGNPAAAQKASGRLEAGGSYKWLALRAVVPTFTVTRAAAVTPCTVAVPTGPRATSMMAFAPGGGSSSASSRLASSRRTAHSTAFPAAYNMPLFFFIREAAQDIDGFLNDTQ